MTSYCPDDDARRIAYVILNFDDNLHEYVEGYLEQLRAFVISAKLSKVEIIFDVKPKFYSATSNSPASQLFVCSTDRSRVSC